jgi:hypothetical protein
MQNQYLGHLIGICYTFFLCNIWRPQSQGCPRIPFYDSSASICNGNKLTMNTNVMLATERI